MVDNAHRMCLLVDNMVGYATGDIPLPGQRPWRTKIQCVATLDGLDTTMLGTLLQTATDGDIKTWLSPFEDLRKFFDILIHISDNYMYLRNLFRKNNNKTIKS